MEIRTQNKNFRISIFFFFFFSEENYSANIAYIIIINIIGFLINVHVQGPVQGPVPTTTKFNPTAFRKAKIAYNFGLSECNRVKVSQLSAAEPDNVIFFLFDDP